jgi:hypothetical protein
MTKQRPQWSRNMAITDHRQLLAFSCEQMSYLPVRQRSLSYLATPRSYASLLSSSNIQREEGERVPKIGCTMET